MNQLDIDIALDRLNEAREYGMHSSRVHRLLAEGKNEKSPRLVMTAIQSALTSIRRLLQPVKIYQGILKVIGLL